MTDEAIGRAFDIIAAMAANPENRQIGERRTAARTRLRIIASQPRPSGPLLEHPNSPCFIATPGGTVTWVSHALAEWVGLPAAALMGDDWLKVIDGDKERKRVAERWMVAAQKRAGLSYTARIRRHSGEIVHCFVRVSQVYAADATQAQWMLGMVHPQILPARLRPPVASGA